MRLNKVLSTMGFLALMTLAGEGYAGGACGFGPTPLWTTPYPGMGRYVVLSSQGSLLTAIDEINASFTTSHKVYKYDLNGSLKLAAWLADPAYPINMIVNVAFDNDENIICASGVPGWGVAKYDKTGNLLWSRSRSATVNSFSDVAAVFVDGNGDVYAGGATGDSGVTITKCPTIIKYDHSDGHTLWEYTGDCAGSGNYIRELGMDPQGYLISVASRWADLSMAVTKQDKNGIVIWTVSLTGDISASERITPATMAVGSHGETLVVGYKNILTKMYALAVLFNSDGAIRWSRTLGTGNYDQAYFAGFDGKGNAYVGGSYDNAWALCKNFIRSYCPDGTTRWERIWGDSENWMSGLAVLSDGTLMLTEVAAVQDASLAWVFTTNVRKYSQGSDGCSVCSDYYSNPNSDTLGQLFEKVKIVGGIRGYINPKRGESATILVKPTAIGEVRVRIYDMAGGLVWDKSVPARAGATEVIQWGGVDSSGKPVPPGLYPVLIEAPGVKYKDKLAVVR